MNKKEIEEIENKLQESADNIKMRKFSEVWKEIEPELAPKKKKFPLKKWLPAVASFCLILAVSITLPLVLRKEKPTRYYFEDLGLKSVQEDEFYSELKKAQIDCVDFSDYYVESYALFQTQSFQTKGGGIDAYDNPDELTMIIGINFFDSSINIVEELYADYQLSYSVNGANIRYKLAEYAEEDGVETYNYLIKAEYRNVTYIIDFTSLSDNVITFFDTLFD